jgi:ferredoxin
MIDCPDVFDSDDEGFAVVTMPVVPGELVDPVRRAEAACPESAISVEPR